MKYILSLLPVVLAFLLIGSCDAQILPINPKRTVSFITDEGSNMDVDVSPDGHTILFDLLGDLYSVPTTGGEAQQLTQGLAISYRPIWSPDGNKIAYISDFSGSLHLNVRDKTGKIHFVLGQTEEQLRDYYTCPVWTPDGNYITIDDRIYGLSGSENVSHLGIDSLIRFSADNKSFFYFDSGKIYNYNRDAYKKAPISGNLKKYLVGELSPDGRWWAYIADSNSSNSLVLSDLVQNTERILVPRAFVNYPFFERQHFCFSADSKTLFIGYGGKIHRIDIKTGIDQVVPFLAHVKADLGPLNYNTFPAGQDSVKVKYVRYANTSPNGRQLVFSALAKIYIMDLPNGKPRLLASQPMGQFQPIYSPDGHWIAYVSWSDTAGGQLWRVAASGGTPEQLTRMAGQYQRPAWSPDGRHIAIVRGKPVLGNKDDPGKGSLDLISLNGNPPTIVADTVPLWNQLTFSPDGKRIIYEPYSYNQYQTIPLLVSKNLDSKETTTIAIGDLKCNSAWLQQRSMSPDGRLIVYSMGEDLYLVPVCQFKGPTTLFNKKGNLTAIRFAQGIDPHWEQNGKALCWTYANKFYRIDPEKILKVAETTAAANPLENDIISLTVRPDQVTEIKIDVPEMHAQGTLALIHVRIITMNANKIVKNGTILIRNGHFIAVGPAITTPIPRGATVLDLAGTTVMPGFIDLHLHMSEPPEITPQQSWLFLINFAYGVTTARDPATSLASFGYEELLRSGKMIGPRLYSSGRPVYLFTTGAMKLADYHDMQHIVQQRAAYSGTFIKQYLLPTRLQQQYLLIASRRAGLNMTNEGPFAPIFTIAMMKDGSTGVEHSPVWGDVYKDITTFIARSGTYWTPTLQVRDGQELARAYSNYRFWRHPDNKLEHFMPETELNEIIQAQSIDTTDKSFIYPSIVAAKIRKQGGRVTLGSHGNNEGIGVHNELWALHMGGLSNLETLKAATIMGAEALGIQKEVGSIEPGKIADLIVLNANPLDDIHNSRNIRYVMKAGILYDGNTLDEIWPLKKKCPEWKPK